MTILLAYWRLAWVGHHDRHWFPAIHTRALHQSAVRFAILTLMLAKSVAPVFCVRYRPPAVYVGGRKNAQGSSGAAACSAQVKCANERK